jgi:hypothetical protein
MAHGLHLSDRVEIVTDRFTPLGVPRGVVGVIIDDWADGSNDVEVSDPKTGDIVARVRAAEDEIRPYSGPITVKDPREHGILFGRGDDLEVGVEAPPMPERGGIQIPDYGPAPMAFSQPPVEDAKVTGEIPWELRDEPPSGPTFH